MGFYRQTQRAALDRAAIARAITLELTTLDASTPADPFLIDHDCRNPAGHDFIGSCGDVACVHCGRVIWA